MGISRYRFGHVLGLLLAVVFAGSVSAADNFPPTKHFAGQDLVLNGKGIRTKLFFDLYTAGLYLPKQNPDAGSILSGNEGVALRMEITSTMITSATMEAAVRDGFALSAGDKLASLQPRIDQLIVIFKEKINNGDLYDFVYRPQNMIVFKNGKQAGTIVGQDFKQAFYAIWLGQQPVQADLKQKLLGGGR